MPGFTTKTNTDPGPFDALRPAGERASASERATRDGLDTLPDGLIGASNGAATAASTTAAGSERSAGALDERAAALDGRAPANDEGASAGTGEDGEYERLYRFQEIPVTAEMRRELLGAKLPLASVEQLADTQPPNKSSMSAPLGPGLVDRHGPTEPALMGPKASAASESAKHHRSLFERDSLLLESDSYSTTAPTLLSVRRRRMRNQRYVIGALAALGLAVLTGIAWRRATRPPTPVARDMVSDRAKTPHIAGNRPGSLSLSERPASDRSAAERPASERPASVEEPPRSERPIPSPLAPAPENVSAGSQTAQPSLPSPDATSSSPPSAGPRSTSSEPRPTARRVTPPPVPAKVSAAGSAAEPAKSPPASPATSKPFNPEELIF